jgi:UDP-N-acetylmuramoyl-tripeptide--D-alanyl-D-alanine ligase
MTKTDRNTLIVDAYNANPTSMAAALENFSNVSAASKVALLGDMLELGADSVQEHKGILSLAAECNFEKIYLVGKEFAAAYGQLQGTPDSFGAELFEDSIQLQEHLKEKPLSGCSILIKGSRGKRLERVIEAL